MIPSKQPSSTSEDNSARPSSQHIRQGTFSSIEGPKYVDVHEALEFIAGGLQNYVQADVP